MSRVFADYDSTYSSHPEIHGLVEAIVTGNSWENSDDIYGQEIDLMLPVFFNPVSDVDNNQSKIILHKAEIINRCGVTRFFEDQPQEVAQLKILCPNCKITLVKEGVTAI